VSLLAAAVLAAGCSDARPEPAAQVAAPSLTGAPAYDGRLAPSAAVLSLVPEDAETLTVTDFDQVRLELGMGGLGDASTPDEVTAFWRRASSERPLLSPGMLRGDDEQLAATHGFTQLDVAWEAHFSTAGDRPAGWVLRFRDDTDMGAVAEAVQDTSGPLAGGTVDATEHLVTKGTTDDPEHSWAAEPETLALVGVPASATYVSRACVEPHAGEDVDDLGAFSVEFEGSLVTARLGAGRQDLFARMRLGAAEPSFAAAYDGGVADPLTGRIGYVMTDPATAAELALEHRLPFAACP
jgi:hypothetical protein